MASAEARVCNRALLRIGQSQRIDGLDQQNSVARACQTLWQDSLEATLEARWWPFARRRATLAAITDGERGGWAFAYPLPADCLAPRYIDLEDGNEGEPVPFETEDDGGQAGALGRVLLTDAESPVLVYTGRVTAVPRFTATFVDCLAYKLASDLALSVAKKPALAEQMLRAFELTLARAAAASAKERKPRKRPRSVFERVR